MNPLLLNISGNLLPAFCWMLVHSLWLGIILVIATGIIILCTGKTRSSFRYTLLAALFISFVAGCAFMFMYELGDSGITRKSGSVLFRTKGWLGITELQRVAGLIQGFCSTYSNWIVLIWFIIFSTRCLRIARAFGYINRVRSTKLDEADKVWTERVRQMCEKLGISKTVLLLESGITKIPVVIGHLKPVIYMPVGLLANLPASQVEAVLLHELAHIRRNDYLFNMFQNIAEAVFFFNPALLWVSSLLREEREYCCDDIALGEGGNKKQFIEALISFKEYAHGGTGYALAFPGRKNSLLHRVSRIVRNTNQTLNTKEKLFFAGSLVLMMILFLAIRKERMQGAGDLAVSEKAAKTEQIAAYHTGVTEKAAGASSPVREEKKVQDNSAKKEVKDRKPEQTVLKSGADENNRNSSGGGSDAEELRQKFWRDQSPVLEPENEWKTKNSGTLASSEDRLNFDEQQAEKNREQAALDRIQAEKDRLQAIKDRERAEIDRMEAEKDRARAEIDRQRAEQDRKRAELDRLRAEQYRKQSQ
jgi:bla regulator protein BlaR1